MDMQLGNIPRSCWITYYLCMSEPDRRLCFVLQIVWALSHDKRKIGQGCQYFCSHRDIQISGLCKLGTAQFLRMVCCLITEKNLPSERSLVLIFCDAKILGLKPWSLVHRWSMCRSVYGGARTFTLITKFKSLDMQIGNVPTSTEMLLNNYSYCICVLKPVWLLDVIL